MFESSGLLGELVIMPVSRSKSDASNRVYQIKVTLKGSKPPIWRRLGVPGDISLAMLHNVLQMAMGWQNGHLHHFILRVPRRKPTPQDIFRMLGGAFDMGAFGGNRYFGDPEFNEGTESDERKFSLAELLPRVKMKMQYEYDFGDGWLHEILVEKILPAEQPLECAQCIAGKLSGPPEDCGGIWGYYDLLEAQANPTHERHAELLEWLGGERWDPENFDVHEVNGQLSAIPLMPTRGKTRSPGTGDSAPAA